MASAEDLKHLVARRGTVKSTVTRFNTFLEKCVTPLSDTIRLELQARLDALKESVVEFEKVQCDIERICLFDTTSNLGNQDDERGEFESKYYALVAKATLLLNPTSTEQPPIHGSSSSMSSSPMLNSHRLNSYLPPIPLPIYSGTYENWTNFKETFEALIENNPTIHKIEKFYYLKSSLKGEAAQIIGALSATEANYETAWHLLCDRYENKRAIIHAHVKSIFELSPTKDESSRSLRKLLDTFVNHFKSLENLGERVFEWSTILIYLLTSKIDINSRKEWERVSAGKQSPDVKHFLKFLSERCKILESVEQKCDQKISHKRDWHNVKSSDKSSTLTALAQVPPRCSLCSDNHFIYSCSKFHAMPIPDRFAKAKELHLCTNCLRSGHKTLDCKSSYFCKTCQNKHHSLLHRTQSESQNHNKNHISSTSNLPQSHQNNPSTSRQPETSCNLYSFNQNPNSFILLATAVVKTFDKNRQPTLARAILDSGSQSNFITQELFEKLNLPYEHVNLPITGINHVTTSLTKRVKLEVKSLNGDFTFKMPALVINQITDLTPQHSINPSYINIPNNITLADPQFYDPSEVHLLIGAGLFFNLMGSGQIKGNKGQPFLQQTKLGWVVSGPVPSQAYCYHSGPSSCFLLSADPLQACIEKFWKIEENYITIPSKYTKEEEECEVHFQCTTIRDDTGRFQVSLPLKPQIAQLGKSYDIAFKRFLSIERKLQKNPILKQAYCEFMSQYIELGHMSKISDLEPDSSPLYYLPHHAVEKNDSLTTKTRIVFDASCPTSTGISLNHTLKVGPVVQSDLFSILLRFRQHNFVFTGDIAKMYRQVLVEPAQRNLQRVIWRNDPSQEITIYQLNTVTYGLASSSYLATRCLKEISIHSLATFPEESRKLNLDTYVDDVVTGASTEQGLISLRRNLTSILSSYGFNLRQFSSNSTALLSDINVDDHKEEYIITDSPNSKTLGISWNSLTDSFIYNTRITANPSIITKRTILSTIASIFDPLGCLGPMIVQAKVLMQKLWIQRLNWDDPIPVELYKIWKSFIDNFTLVNSFNIPRQVTTKDTIYIELHGFSDSSINAYGACIYVRSIDIHGRILSNLLCAKSRVAPLKAISLPRLELCGALTLARLTKNVIESLELTFSKIYFYTDSTIVLCWLGLEPRTLKTFVCNRVSEIQQLTKIDEWHHIPSNVNPADIISRGASPSELHECDLWWHGPSFLLQSQDTWPSNNHISNFTAHTPDLDLMELNPKSIVLSSQVSHSILISSLVNRYSSYTKLRNVLAYCFRFIYNAKTSREFRIIGDLTLTEMVQSTHHLVRHVQRESFPEDIHQLKSHGKVKPSSKLSSLNVFLDDLNIIRVGGRLRHASIQFSAKHPVLLPHKHPLTELIIFYEHKRNLHPGAQATLSFVRQSFWPLNGRNVVRNVLRKCIPCFRSNAQPMDNLMGDLPPSRVNISHPFARSGVDYAGPFKLKESKFRNRRFTKAYICVFVCLTTKAIHIELASELTSECFLSILRRFVARRGLCTDLYSDNGTNFTGANNELQGIYNVLKTNAIRDFSQENKITWHFIPARSPHFGGLWESAIKSIKTHLYRIINNSNPLSYEELYTLLVQIEGVLNSRPLFPMSNDPNDMEVLTPGHFLIGHPLNMVPAIDYEDFPINRLTRFELLQRMMQHFWSRWKNEYLHTLQQREKWRYSKDTAKLQGQMVLLKDDGLPPYQWSRGRISALHPGKDGLVRVVSVATPNGTIKRSITKLCPLPHEQ